VKRLNQFGQSPWLDYIRRSLLTNQDLQRLIKEDGISGVTSNPTIFEKAIAGSSDYDEQISELLKSNPELDEKSIFEELAIDDIQKTADILRPVYEKSSGLDGFVSLELPPDLAHNSKKEIIEARRLWKKINRPNLMLKIPATKEGIPVIETLIAEGININITLMFSVDHYEAVVRAYLNGLKKCGDPSKVSSVASFFLSRIDTIVDKLLDEKSSVRSKELKGKVAIAVAKKVYQRFKEIFTGNEFLALKSRGAHVQKVLWASTGTKNPEYSDLLYVESLIGQDTINTMPPATLNAFRDHGKSSLSLEENITESEKVLGALEKMDINLIEVGEDLQVKGVKAFADSYESLLNSLRKKKNCIIKGDSRIILRIGDYQPVIDDRLEYWRDISFVKRLSEKDPALWVNKDSEEISNRLGWLILPELMSEYIREIIEFSEEVRKEGFIQIVLLGMGGSSLAPEVFRDIFGSSRTYPELIVLDSTHPTIIKKVEKKLDLKKSLFIVSSKSGTTLETLSLFRYFWNKVGNLNSDPGKKFVAITDKDTYLMNLAIELGFRRIFQGISEVGGRYSALSVFGLVPAALIGVDISKIINTSWEMSENSAFCVSPKENSGLLLGSALGELANLGLDKLTFISSKSIRSFPKWLEQLIAESTGKDGKGIIPIVDEPLTNLNNYGQDRIFINIFKDDERGLEDDHFLNSLHSLGHPVIDIRLDDEFDLGRQMFCWEISVAAAGAVIDINPFDQPNVEISKELARQELNDSQNNLSAELDLKEISIQESDNTIQRIRNWIESSNKGDYISIHAYLDSSPKITDTLQNIRKVLLDKTRLATTFGYGPRFLHFTGQLHKGGSKKGLFLQIVDESEEELRVPETDYTFNKIIKSQSIGDYQALKKQNRNVLRLNLKDNALVGLQRFLELISNI